MSNKKYVPQGVYLACDKGTAPTEFKITNNNNSFLFDQPIANTGDMAPMLNVLPFGSCTIKNNNPCVPAPVAWEGFEDGIFVGNFNPLLEDSVLPCSLGGKIEIFYSLGEAQDACAEEKMSFWKKVGIAVLVVAAVALVVISGGAALAAIGAMAAASAAGTLTVGAAAISTVVIVAEVAGMAFGIKGLYDYAKDGDEEALFKEVALGYLFLGAGAAIGRGYRAWKASRAVDEGIEVLDDAARAGDEVAEVLDDVPYDQLGKKPPCFLAGTMVKTPLGNIEIEKLKVDDKVVVYDFKENCVTEKSIVKLYNNWTNRYFKIVTNDDNEVLATSRHLVWVDNHNKWIPTKELKVGMDLKGFSNEIISITSIEETQEVDLPTYNLEIEDIHNYFVGRYGLLVHNQNEPSLFESTIKSNAEIYEVTNLQTGKVEYVGQTVQGTETRLGQHIAEGKANNNLKADWGDPTKYDVKTVKSGNWTPYEAHAWEQHYIEKNGGKAKLKNVKNAITETKYGKYAHLHNPC